MERRKEYLLENANSRSWLVIPIILGNQIWLTTATSDGRQLYALCIDRETGKILRDLKLFDVESRSIVILSCPTLHPLLLSNPVESM
jgi:hypothetical protein